MDAFFVSETYYTSSLHANVSIMFTSSYALVWQLSPHSAAKRVIFATRNDHPVTNTSIITSRLSINTLLSLVSLTIGQASIREHRSAWKERQLWCEPSADISTTATNATHLRDAKQWREVATGDVRTSHSANGCQATHRLRCSNENERMKHSCIFARIAAIRTDSKRKP